MISSISKNSIKQKLFVCLQFKMSNSSIWPIDRTLSGATTLSQSGPRSDGNEVILCIPQSSSITGASPSDCLMLYAGHLLVAEQSYLSPEMQLVYSTALAYWAWLNRKTTKSRKQKWEEKQLYGFLKRQTEEIALKKTLTCVRKRNLKREIESLLIANTKQKYKD